MDILQYQEGINFAIIGEMNLQIRPYIAMSNKKFHTFHTKHLHLPLNHKLKDISFWVTNAMNTPWIITISAIPLPFNTHKLGKILEFLCN